MRNLLVTRIYLPVMFPSAVEGLAVNRLGLGRKVATDAFG